MSSRGNAAKQLIFVNGRMVEYRKIMNALIQVWRDYEPRTLPVMVINFILPGEYFDINLSTDKRQILFVRVVIGNGCKCRKTF
ncbi:uncharacterized protein [Blastocystis hominis]|uniref:DNA mismatch repair protein S5 domain-containing protein n=1 Tax=Blastocystis hominis TaxID=12968 RepID=D8M4L0_BLAHO|nr:uncharacterized protein [Blastocystis hominis]CBK22999.2 unnamed protein product [Blastocystis hominis]|eukprot:XP_012897047.1 uncharacterized protein [Blastocystis hominis]